MEGGDIRMSSIDERVVNMRFNNRQFEQGIARTRDSLGRFTKELQMTGATKGLENVDAAAQKVPQSMENIEQSVSGIAGKFKAMGVVATTALATVAHAAVAAGGRLIKSMTLDPIIDGFHEYETNMNSIQTILANTQAAGMKLKDVTGVLDELNHYSDQTIYNFSEMAKNIGTFTAAGVDLHTAAGAIKGIANLAALSGSNSEQAAGAMYQLSQAISSGRVSLEDWNSVVNAGMGGTVFQRALAQNAVAMGKLNEGAVKLTGSMKNVSINGKSFRESISAVNGDSWLTGDVLTQTLEQFTGDLSDAELAAEGFSKAQIKAIQKQAETARNAATQVKTLTQLMGTIKESVGSGWAHTWKIIFGDFNEAKGMFTSISDRIGKMVSESAHARNKMLSDWKKFGGRDALIEGLSNAFDALLAVMKPIKDAFREMFPATTGKQLAAMTKTFRDFTEKLKIGGETAKKLKRSFAGIFAVLGIGWDIIKEVAKTLFDLFGVVADGSGGFLEVTANIGDFLVNLREAIHKGDALSKVFKVIGKVLAAPIKLIEKLGGALLDLFDNGDKASESLGKVTEKLGPLGKLGEMVRKAWTKVMDILGKLGDFIGPIGEKIGEVLGSIGEKIASGLQNISFDDVLNTLNTGLFAGIVLLVKKMVDAITDKLGGGDEEGGFISAITAPFQQLTDTLSAMQSALKATTLLEIAIAIGVLTLAVAKLAKIDAEGLEKAGAALSVMFAQLFGAMAIFEKISGFKGFFKMPFVAASLILLATAADILASAVKKLSDIDWEALGRGLSGMAVLLGELVGAMHIMPNPKGLISTSLGLIVLGGAIHILVSAVSDLSGFSWENLAKGLVGVGTLLGSLVLFTRLANVDKAGLIQGAGLILLAAGIKILASAMDDFTGFSWGEIAKGLTAMAGGLAILTAALMLIPPTAVLSAAGVLIVSLSLGKVADALAKMGGMSWGEIGKSLTAMLGALTLIAAALYVIPPTAVLGAAGVLVVAIALKQVAEVLNTMAEMSWEEIGKAMTVLAGSLISISLAIMVMTGALAGAAAMLIVAASLRVMLPVLLAFSQMSWMEIIKGLTMLAGVFVVLGLAGLVLAPLVPVLIGLGVAITLIGIAMLAAGAGVFLFATGLTALAAAGTAGAAAIVGIVSGLLGLIPLVMKEIGLGIIAFAKVIKTAGPAITDAIVTVLNSFMDAIIRLTPKITKLFHVLVKLIIDVLTDAIPKMVDAGLDILQGILKGIDDHIEDITDTALDIISNFIDGIGDGLPDIIDSGVDLIIKFVNGVADAIDDHSEELGRAGGRLAVAIIKGMAKGIWGGASEIASAAKSVAKSALNAAKSFLGIHSPSKEFEKIGRYSDEGMALGLDRYSHVVSKSATQVGSEALDSIKKSLSGLSSGAGLDVDMHPTITPVLDLSEVKKSARDIPKALEAHRVSTDMAYAKARIISEARASEPAQWHLEAVKPTVTPITFNQYNRSPKALNSAEIYRQTSNQISRAKEALPTS